jgi:hypothetical protein
MQLKHLSFLVLLLPLLASCSAGGGSRSAPLSDEEQLTTRPTERWQHLIARRGEQAWEYLSPGYRSTRDKADYIKRMTATPVTWLNAEHHSLECDDSGVFCAVNLKVSFRVASRQLGVGEIESFNFLTERWIRVDGIWYHVPEDVSG